MNIGKKVKIQISFTKEEETTISKFLDIVREFSDRCDSITDSCDNCPLYGICDYSHSSVEDFKKALETIEEE